MDEKCLCFAVEEIMEPRWMKKLKMKKGQSKSTVLKTWILNSHWADRSLISVDGRTLARAAAALVAMAAAMMFCPKE